jgi:PPOX class probable FMN-dependent enzyme
MPKLEPEPAESDVTSLEQLRAIYSTPGRAAIVKEINYIHPVYRAFIEASPFVVLATAGSGGVDSSPRGDGPGFVHVENEKVLLLPDRRGNNRVDSLENVLLDPRIGLLFLIPGIGETLRVNGNAKISVAEELLDRFIVAGQRPISVLRIEVSAVYFQCSRAMVRSRLWDQSTQIARSSLPSTGTILAEISRNEIDRVAYDTALPDRVKNTLY